MKRLVPFLSVLLLASCGVAPTEEKQAPSNGQSSAPSISSVSSIPSLSLSSSRSPLNLPRSVDPLPVPFSPQAPFANWDPLHEESCEEMSLIMVHHYLAGETLTREQAEQEILDLVKWETEHGYPWDVTIVELGEIAEKYYGYTPEVIENPTVETLKRLLVDGNPIIVPAAGRDLGNPYFSGEGPWYHMLVLTGYDWWNFITNDPGTKRGEGYTYRFSVLLDVIHDWTGVKEEIRMGPRRVLVLKKG